MLWTSNSWQQKPGTRDADFVNATSALGDTILPLRDAIRVWQSDEGDPSDVSAAMNAAFSAMCALPNGPRLGVRDTDMIVNQMNALRVRQDSAPITTPALQTVRNFI